MGATFGIPAFEDVATGNSLTFPNVSLISAFNVTISYPSQTTIIEAVVFHLYVFALCFVIRIQETRAGLLKTFRD